MFFTEASAPSVSPTPAFVRQTEGNPAKKHAAAANTHVGDLVVILSCAHFTPPSADATHGHACTGWKENNFCSSQLSDYNIQESPYRLEMLS